MSFRYFSCAGSQALCLPSGGRHQSRDPSSAPSATIFLRSSYHIGDRIFRRFLSFTLTTIVTYTVRRFLEQGPGYAFLRSLYHIGDRIFRRFLSFTFITSVPTFQQEISIGPYFSKQSSSFRHSVFAHALALRCLSSRYPPSPTTLRCLSSRYPPSHPTLHRSDCTFT